MPTKQARKATPKTPKLSPEMQAAAELTAPVTAAEMVELLEEEADGWIDSNSNPTGDASTVELNILRTVHIFREAANFIRTHSKGGRK